MAPFWLLFWACPSHASTVNNDINGLISSVNDGSTSAFMWEWFTTKPFADAGDVRFVSRRQCFQDAWVDARDEDWFCPNAMAFVVNRRSFFCGAGAWGGRATFPRKFDNVCSTIWFGRKSCRGRRWFYHGEIWLSRRRYQGKTGVQLWGPILTHHHRLGFVLLATRIIVPHYQEESY